MATDMARSVHIGTTASRLLTLAALWLLGGEALRAAAPVRWAVCYSDRPSPADLARYDLIVLDPDRHPALGPIHAKKRRVLAYLSLTELGAARRPFDALDRAGVLLGPHPAWAGSHYVDVRRPEWTRAVLEDMAPRALAAGFTGLFLDTLDDADFLESQDPVRYGGVREASAALVLALRARYPDATIMVNRGYALLPAIASSIDAVLGESVLATFRPETNAYARVSPPDVEWQVTALRRARALNPSLAIFTLDYWDPADRDGIRRLYREQRANGFIPYVSTPRLDSLVQEPR